MEVRAFKMRTGEDIVAKVVKEEGDAFTIEDVAVPIAQPEVGPSGAPTGRETVSLLRWTPFAKEGSTFTLTPADYVSNPYYPNKDVERLYLEATSGIMLAQPQALNG